jgi:hypothetical protein
MQIWLTVRLGVVRLARFIRHLGGFLLTNTAKGRIIYTLTQTGAEIENTARNHYCPT